MDKPGLVGYEGLDILLSTAFPRPVQIMRQTIPNLETGISSISTYHANQGLSSALKVQGIKKDIQSYWYNKPYKWGMGLLGHIGLVVWKK
jgi:hypothetical protein